MTEVNAVKQTKSLEITSERNRVRVARAEHRSYSTEALQKLTSDLGVINNGDSRLRQLRLLSIAPPDRTEDAQSALGDALAGVSEAYSALPEHVRSCVSLPRLPEAPQFPEHIQNAFWKELLSGSAPAVLMVLFAGILDLVPPFVRFASSPKQTLDERILSVRRWIRRIRYAIDMPLAVVVESVKITVPEAPALDIHMTVPASHGGPVLDIDRDFQEISREVCLETGREMVLDTVKTASGKPLVDGSPFLDQLGEDREVRLGYVPKGDPDLDAYSGEVN
jgi:hypothetical protein